MPIRLLGRDDLMPQIEVLYRQISDLIKIIDSAEAASVPAERRNHVLLAMAAISRCRSLLLGSLELHRAGRTDIIGVPVRALLEVWYFGVIALLGDDADLRRLAEDHRHWKNDLAKHVPGVRCNGGEAGRFSVFQRAKRADQLLAEMEPGPDVAVKYYRLFYAPESLMSAHAGFESLKAYVFEDADGTIGIVSEPEANGVNYGRLYIAFLLTLLLAKWTWDRAGLDSSPFDEIEASAD